MTAPTFATDSSITGLQVHSTAGLTVLRAKRGEWKRPRVQREPADAERMLEALVGARGVPVERHRETESDLAHRRGASHLIGQSPVRVVETLPLPQPRFIADRRIAGSREQPVGAGVYGVARRSRTVLRAARVALTGLAHQVAAHGAHEPSGWTMQQSEGQLSWVSPACRTCCGCSPARCRFRFRAGA